MRSEVRMGVERDQVHIPDLGIFHVANHLSGEILVLTDDSSQMTCPAISALSFRKTHRQDRPPPTQSPIVPSTRLSKPFTQRPLPNFVPSTSCNKAAWTVPPRAIMIADRSKPHQHCQQMSHFNPLKIQCFTEKVPGEPAA
jgi:hypothetical protein